MNRVIHYLAGLFLVLALTGCIQVEQTLQLASDGSGVLMLRYGMTEETLAQMEAMEQMAKAFGNDEEDSTSDLPFEFDEDRVREEFAANQVDGLELRTVRAETVDGWRYMNLEIAFDRLELITEHEFYSDNRLTLQRNAAGHYVLTQYSGDEDSFGLGNSGMELDELEGAILQQMASLFEGMRIVSTVITPSAIIDSNADVVERKRASWIFDIDQDPAVLQRMKTLEMRLVFDGKGVTLPTIDTQAN